MAAVCQIDNICPRKKIDDERKNKTNNIRAMRERLGSVLRHNLLRSSNNNRFFFSIFPLFSIFDFFSLDISVIFDFRFFLLSGMCVCDAWMHGVCPKKIDNERKKIIKTNNK